MNHRMLASLVLVCLATVSVLTASCDPQKATLEIFRRQGLNLLKPARDYIRVGGVVVRRGNGPMEYIDPLDTVNPQPGGAGAFKATILAETAKHTAKFGLALGLIKSILPGSLNLSGGSETEVKLDQINSSGLRLTDAEMTTLVRQKATAAAIAEELGQGLNAWVIQEVYSADQMQVSASNSTSFDVKFADGSAVQECKAEKPPTKPEEKPTAKPGDKPTEKPGEKPAAKPTEKPGEKPTEKPAAAPAPATAKTAEVFSVGVGVCRTGTASLMFKAEKPGVFIPFAVRLKQVENRQGKLAFKRGTVAPNATLGPDRPRFALIDPTTPVVSELQRRKPR